MSSELFVPNSFQTTACTDTSFALASRVLVE
jgi:hypothetical protein